MNFANLLKECNQHYNHDTKHVYHPPKKFLPSLGNHYSAVTIILQFHTSRIIQHVVLWVWLLSHCLMLFPPPQSKRFIDLLRCLQILKVTQPGLRTHSRGPEGAGGGLSVKVERLARLLEAWSSLHAHHPQGTPFSVLPLPYRPEEGRERAGQASRLCITAWRGVGGGAVRTLPPACGPWGPGLGRWWHVPSYPQMDHSLSWGLS